jgi:hypothetical protein
MLQVIYLMRLMLLSKELEAGTNINSGNINNTQNSTQILGLIKTYAPHWIFHSSATSFNIRCNN